MTLNINDTQRDNSLPLSRVSHFIGYLLIVIRLCVVMLSVIIQSVVVAPIKEVTLSLFFKLFLIFLFTFSDLPSLGFQYNNAKFTSL